MSDGGALGRFRARSAFQLLAANSALMRLTKDRLVKWKREESRDQREIIPCI